MISRIFSFETIRDILIYLLPIAGISGILLPLLIGHSELAVLGSYLGIPLIVAPIIYLYSANWKQTHAPAIESKFFTFLIIYVLLFALSILLLYFYEIRPLQYFVIITAIYIIIAIEILYYKNKSNFASTTILLQIVITSVGMLWGVNLKYFFFFGRTDILAHAWLAQSLIVNGYVTKVFGIYSAFPLWHILVTMVYHITGIDIPVYKLMFIINGFVSVGGILLIYIISMKLLSNNKEIALLSALFLSLNTDFIFYGMYSISRSIIGFLFLLLILSLFQRQRYPFIVLSFLVSLSVIIYHPASMPFILVILLALLILQRLLDRDNKKEFLDPRMFILLIIMTMGYWVYQSVSIAQTVVSTLFGETNGRSVPIGEIMKASVPINEVVNYLQYSPLLLFVILGFLFVAGQKKLKNIQKIICLTGLLLTAVAFPGPSLLLERLAENFNILRFGGYAILFITIAGATGMYYLFRNSKRIPQVVVILLFASMCFLSISNDFTSSDNPLMKRTFYTYYFTEQEVMALDHNADNAKGYLMADYISTRYTMQSKYTEKAHILETDSNGTILLRHSADDILFIRDGELSKRPIQYYLSPGDKFALLPAWGNYVRYVDGDARLWSSISRYDKIYDSGETYSIT